MATMFSGDKSAKKAAAAQAIEAFGNAFAMLKGRG